MLQTGLNPFGIAYTVGLQGKNTARANPNGIGLAGFVNVAEEIGARTIEIPVALLEPLDEAALSRLDERLRARGIKVVLSHPLQLDSAGIRCAQALKAKVFRMCLTSVLCGDRAEKGSLWPEMVENARTTLKDSALLAAAHQLTLAIENHQDLTSAELVEISEAAGPNVGVCLDIGNALAVGEDPRDFARTVAPRVRHVHLKDYRAQWTDEGYRLVRCAIGDGAVPFIEVAQILAERHETLTASIEVGALAARHIRLLTPHWWEGYPDRSARALAAGLAAARVRRLGEDDAWQTPWEAEADGAEIVRYETDMLHKSVANLKQMGLWG
jgi:sugar phosphate isomerase/epimerase